ncbi:MAG: hypothetical protein ABSE85_15420 [Candidatus Korobacteraceae bacterium]|jgi:hypothetical protein
MSHWVERRFSAALLPGHVEEPASAGDTLSSAEADPVFRKATKTRT